MNIPLSAPDLTNEERTAVSEVLMSPRLSLGPKLREFEENLAAVVGAKYAVAVNSGTSALHLCMKAANIGAKDEVITTPFSFVASANSILFEHGTPVFVDIDPATYNIDVARVADAITEKTKAILAVHVFGRPCEMNSLVRIAERHGLLMIEDGCEAIGARYQDKAVGTFGQSGTFAFYPNKQITTGEGGAIVTNDDRIAKLCCSWRNQGRAEDGGWLEHERLGYNYRLSDINCALGTAQLRRLPEILTARARAAALYTRELAGLSQLILPRLHEPDAELSWFVYVVRLGDEFTMEHRDAVLRRLKEYGIGCGKYFTPIHLQPFYRSIFGYRKGDFSTTEHISERTVALPFFNRISTDEIEYVGKALRQILSQLSIRRAVRGWSKENVTVG